MPILSPDDHRSLTVWGLDEGTCAAFGAHQGLGDVLGRVCSVHYGGLFVETARGRVLARPSGKSALRAQLLVGDWVVLAIDESGTATIHALLPRISELVRLGSDDKAQAMLSNVNRLVLVFSCDMDLEAVRPREFQTVAETCALDFMIVLTKPDVASADVRIEALRADGFECPVLTFNGVTGEGLDALAPYLAPCATIALMGASGVGKSTLLNHLARRAASSVGDIRKSDGKGRHTTTHREIFRTPSGALIVDTPGMRVFRASVRPPAK